MPMWMWIDNVSEQYNTNPYYPLNATEMGEIVGYTAAGKNEIKPVEMSGDNASVGITGGSWYDTYHQTYGLMAGHPGTNMVYTSPDLGPVTDAKMTATADAVIRIKTLENNAEVTVGDFTGIVVQMSNGDMFFRPHKNYAEEWDVVTSIYSIEIMSVSNSTRTQSINPDIGFNPDIVDIEILPCFTRGTMIKTINGDVLIESLCVGDLVATLDSGFQPIMWIGSKETPISNISGMEKIRPIRISAGALGEGQPAADLLVSPQHRMLVRSKAAQRMTGSLEALVAAKHLVGTKGIEAASDVTSVEYFHILFSRHEVIFANGAQAESLYTGPEAIKALPRHAVDEIFTMFPELRNRDYSPTPARLLVTGRIGRQLASRHAANGKSLVIYKDTVAAE